METAKVWQAFSSKIMCARILYNYYLFFEQVILNLFQSLINENVIIVEIRHVLGRVLDDNEKFMSVKEEILIF